MKKTLMLAMTTLLTAVSFASAAEPVQHGNKLYEYNFLCEFGENGAPPVGEALSTESPDHGKKCFAAAQVFAYGRDHHDVNSLEQAATNLTNKMAVLCNGELVYANGALLNATHKFVQIAPVGQEFPSIFVKRKDGHDFGAQWMEYDAALKTHHGWLKGECKVQREFPGHGGHHLNLN